MLRSSVQMYGETVTPVEVQDIVELLNSNKIRLLSLRDCTLLDPCFEKLMEGVGRCKCILHLNLNLNMVTSCSRAWMLANAISCNRSLLSLFVHGSTVGERGMCMVLEAVNTHPSIVSLDLGDCQLKDHALFLVSKLLAPRGVKKGLQDLSVSGNCGISSFAWSRFFLDMSACNKLQSLSLDYNKIGDYGVGCLACALVHSRHLQTLDLEGCGINECGAEILLHLMRNYFPVSMKQITLSGNSISRNTIEKIDAYLESDEKESSDSESIKITKDPCCEFEKKCSGDPRLAVTDGATVTAVDVCEPEKRRKKGHKRK